MFTLTNKILESFWRNFSFFYNARSNIMFGGKSLQTLTGHWHIHYSFIPSQTKYSKYSCETWFHQNCLNMLGNIWAALLYLEYVWISLLCYLLDWTQWVRIKKRMDPPRTLWQHVLCKLQWAMISWIPSILEWKLLMINKAIWGTFTT